MRIKILGPIVSFLIGIFAISIVVVIASHSLSNISHNTNQKEDNNPNAITLSETPAHSSTSTTSGYWTLISTEENPFTKFPTDTQTIIPTTTLQPTATITPTATTTIQPSATPTPTATITATPNIMRHGYTEICDEMVYEGIQRCILGPYQIVRIDPKNPHVRFEVVLPMGYDRYGNYAECLDVQLPDSVQPGESTGPGCYIGHSYPAERVGQMAKRYPGAVVAFNGDFFSPSYAHGAMGLTVKNGQRLDGNDSDREGREVRRSSLSISTDGEVRIGPIPWETLPNPDEPWTWIPDPDLFYNTIGGLPMLVKNGHPVDLHEQCMQEEGWCPDQYYPRARTAFGVTFDKKVFVVIVPEERGLTIEGLAHLMVELGAMEAINIDGGGSSQLWYAGTYLYYSSRIVAECLIVFSIPIPPDVDVPIIP